MTPVVMVVVGVVVVVESGAVLLNTGNSGRTSLVSHTSSVGRGILASTVVLIVPAV